ncbi:MAG: GreA/GreB family elongation factor [Deltaproteobacteria bacterium]|nr:GreA/GreB family elongation factor [Deltaproteobacteria bacterium]
MTIDKEALKAVFVSQVQADLDAALLQQKTAQNDATHEEARAENDKDTRGLESSYLARGLARRAMEFKATLAALKGVSTRVFSDDEKVGLAALVTIEDDSGEERIYFMVSSGGGLKAEIAELVVKIVTPDSPLGKALMGRELDDEILIHTPKGKREAVISNIA